ncbi:YajG family lipoprotein [Oceanobacter mangrovi]|uniref:YajG family lipoprotein n=1 Tax=Oceanobacter mangrovi TaxID=2862510 RepID=UPI001C8D9604|nr:YajG family lipoprotein [Oceanobacter mangrovi]
MPDLSRLLRTTAIASVVTLGLSGCVLSPQVIELNEQTNIDSQQLQQPRNALIRVVDKRGVDEDLLGYRGGRMPENSPLLASTPLKEVLTNRLRSTMAQLGFGGSSQQEALKVQLDINSFDYECDEGVMVNECRLDMTLSVEVMDGASKFDKPYTMSESRSVVASPSQEYNQQWLNESIDKLWSHIFADKELLMKLGVSQ